MEVSIYHMQCTVLHICWNNFFRFNEAHCWGSLRKQRSIDNRRRLDYLFVLVKAHICTRCLLVVKGHVRVIPNKSLLMNTFSSSTWNITHIYWPGSKRRPWLIRSGIFIFSCPAARAQKKGCRKLKLQCISFQFLLFLQVGPCGKFAIKSHLRASRPK